MDDRTTRERIADVLRDRPDTPRGLASEFGVSRGTILTHVQHIAQSLDGETAELLVRPPACQECGFDEFDEPLNVPSRCPSCKHEGIAEPAFVIE